VAAAGMPLTGFTLISKPCVNTLKDMDGGQKD
jgi:hypothetical protein